MRGLAHKLAMHAVGAVPRYLSRGEVPAAALDAERAVLTEQAARSGKPAGIVEKVVHYLSIIVGSISVQKLSERRGPIEVTFIVAWLISTPGWT